MWLGFLLEQKTGSFVALCSTRTPQGDIGLYFKDKGKWLHVASGIYEDSLSSYGATFWRYAKKIFAAGRSLYLQIVDSRGRPVPLEFDKELLEAFEHAPTLLPLEILSEYRSLDGRDELKVLFACKGNDLPKALDIDANALPRMPWLFHVLPQSKSTTNKSLKSLAALTDAHPTLEKRILRIGNQWQENSELFRLPLPTGKEWMRDTAALLGMMPLHDKGKSNVYREEGRVSWRNDILPALGLPQSIRGLPESPIFSDSLIEQAFSAPLKDIIFCGDETERRRNFQHIVIKGAAGTGKSTLGKLILLHELLQNPTANVVYMGPTRMLVEEAHADFLKLAESINAYDQDLNLPPESIVVSTGELAADDERIRRGDFRALFIVYEKLDTFFTNSDLLERLKGVLIDEMQMIGDLARGGALDALITRLLREAQNRCFKSESKPLRIIACTTENYDLTNRFKVSPRPGQPPREPLVLEDRQPFCAPSLWLQFKSPGIQLPPLNLNTEYELKRLCASNNKTDNLTYKINIWAWADLLREWMWGHEKVLYVSSNPEHMRQLAVQLAKRRPNLPLQDPKALQDLEQSFEASELSTSARQNLIELTKKGIFFNFSNMGHAARSLSAQLYEIALPLPNIPVIAFATTTIMYGVNLPADLVILHDLKWPQNNIDRKTGTHMAFLTAPEAANILGRVGRAGKANPNILPEALICANWSYIGEKSFTELMERLNNPTERLESKVLEWDGSRGSSRLDDFYPTQQHFFLRSLLHSAEKSGGIRLKEVLDFIAESCAWENVRANHREQKWKSRIENFFTLFANDYPEALSIVKERGELFLNPLPLAYIIVQSGTDLTTLWELREIAAKRNWEQGGPIGNTICMLLSLLLSREGWANMLTFHVEPNWGFFDGKSMRLKDAQQDHLDRTQEEESAMKCELASLLESLTGHEGRHILDWAVTIFDAGHYPVSFKSTPPEGIGKRRKIMFLRGALALLHWCMGSSVDMVNRFRYADAKIPNSELTRFYEYSFSDRMRWRLRYILWCFKYYCNANGSPQALVEAIESASAALAREKPLEAAN